MLNGNKGLNRGVNWRPSQRQPVENNTNMCELFSQIKVDLDLLYTF
jgi:hypothetical protein